MSQGTSLRLATRPRLKSTGEYGGSGPPGKARGPGRRRKAAARLTVFGVVQGVGFRPYVYRLARRASERP
jgi:hypothetical protein